MTTNIKTSARLTRAFSRFRLHFDLHMKLATAMFTGCAFGLLLLCIHDFRQSDTPPHQTDNAASSLSAQQPLGWMYATQEPTPALSAEPSDPSALDATELSRGSEQSSHDRGYRCKEGFTPVDMLLGSATQHKGSLFRLTEKRSGPSAYDDQLSVTLSLKLDSKTTVPTIIINSAAHNMRPDTYPQFKKQVGLKPNAVATFTLVTQGYADNYLNAGITDVTLCSKS